jgi:hypothetical protein
MRKPHESSADRIWREALESCASRQETIVLAVVLMVLAAAVFIVGA